MSAGISLIVGLSIDDNEHMQIIYQANQFFVLNLSLFFRDWIHREIDRPVKQISRDDGDDVAEGALWPRKGQCSILPGKLP